MFESGYDGNPWVKMSADKELAIFRNNIWYKDKFRMNLKSHIQRMDTKRLFSIIVLSSMFIIVSSLLTVSAAQASTGGALERLGELLGLNSTQNNASASNNIEMTESPPDNSSFSQTRNQSTNNAMYEDIGFSLEHPSDWQPVDPGIEYGLAAFMSPDNSASITVKLIPRDDDESLAEFGEDFKDPEYMQLTKFYRNSTTTLGGLPGLIATGIFTYNPNVFQQAAGEQGYTSRVYQAWGLSEERDGFYGIIFSADSKLAYDEHLPIAKRIIDSFNVDEAGPVIQEDIEGVQEDSGDNEPDDTFVGSAGNNGDESNGNEND